MQLSRILFGLSLGLLQPTFAQTYHGPEDHRLDVALTLDTPTTGVSISADGRIFLILPRLDGSTGPPLVEYHTKDNTTTAYPNIEWNSYEPGKDPATHFVRLNSQRIGPDGNLWLVDKGAPTLNGPNILPGGPKIIVVDITKNKVSRTYPLDTSARSDSFVDDIRFGKGNHKAYLTDAGSPGFIVLDLETGESRRVLDNHLSTREYSPLSAEGEFLYYAPDTPLYTYNDHIEVSPDGKWVYYQPASGGMSRIESKWLDEAFYNSSLNSNKYLGKYVQPFAHTPSTGGTAIDAEGNIYDSDTDSQRIIKISPNGTMTTLVQDPRLLWVDAMWIDRNQRLWMPVAQLNRAAVFHNGENRITTPSYVYTIDIGVGPSQIDHE